MKTIIAIGGGDLRLQTTKKIDEFILQYSHKKNPKVLFIPTASKDNDDYIKVFTNYYQSMNAIVDVLCLSKIEDTSIIKNKIMNTDIIYIGGGNTQRMLRIFKRYSVSQYLKEAYEKGIILCGLSAGCACFFKACYSDCNRSTNPNNELTYLKCLDFLPYLNCPHYNAMERKSFDQWLLQYQEDGIAIEDDVAICFEDQTIRQIIKSDNKRNAYFLKQGNKSIL